MSWDTAKSLEEIREEFLGLMSENKASVTELCRQYGISRKTAYKWKKRKESGDSLLDKSRRPLRSPAATSPAIVSEILALRAAHQTLGGTKISLILKQKGFEGVPAGSTVTGILRRNDLLNPRAVAEATHLQRFSKNAPNEMWQADFKGNFELESGRRCHPLNIIDDCSRYALVSVPLINETLETVRPRFIVAFRTYGLPDSILCDNGNPWGSSARNSLTTFDVWAMELGILVIHGRPLHPQTQGKEERFNKSWKRECLEKLGPRPNFADVVSETEAFRCFYNEERPHFGIGGKTPSELYRHSEREYPERIRNWVYDEWQTVRHVDNKGCIRLNGDCVFISEGLRYKNIATVPSESHPECLNLIFRDFRIGRLNMSTRKLEYLRAYKLVGDPRTTLQN